MGVDEGLRGDNFFPEEAGSWEGRPPSSAKDLELAKGVGRKTTLFKFSIDVTKTKKPNLKAYNKARLWGVREKSVKFPLRGMNQPSTGGAKGGVIESLTGKGQRYRSGGGGKSSVLQSRSRERQKKYQFGYEKKGKRGAPGDGSARKM